jgi:ribosomal protein S15P/S13E
MTKTAKNSLEEFCCIGCSYNTSQRSQYDRHLMTAKHLRMQDGFEKGKKKYECKVCNFNTSHSNKYIAHLTTAKHTRMQTESQNSQKEISKKGLSSEMETDRSINICKCGREYKYRQGLHRHKKTCFFISESKVMDEKIENTFTPANMMEFIVNIVKTNEDIKHLMIEQLRHHMESEKKQLETQKQLIELVKEPRTFNSYNTNTNSNNSFNLQFFLNETCKDAINVSEFIENIKIDFSDVENVGKNGYITGITNMIVKNLADLGTTKRPFHCTDTKRETIYIKDNDKWDKDNETKEKFQKVLNQIYNKNWNVLRNWSKANHPEICVLDSRENKLYHKILEQTDCIKGLDKLPEINEKIIKKLSETIKVERALL